MLEDKKKVYLIILKLFLYFFYCFIGTIGTIVVVLLDINSIVASSLVSIIVAFFTVTINDENHFSWATFCGSFAGMTSLAILEANYSSLSINFILNSLVLATITSFIYALSEFISYKFPKVSFDGYGGRLGTIAFISVILYILILKFGFNKNFNFFSNENIFKTKLDYFLLFAIVSSIIASLISMEIKNTVSSLNENYKVITVATTGLIGGILITKFQSMGLDYGLAWYTGAFVGMSSYYVLMLKRHFFISGLFAGIYFILTRNIFIGVGGKLGFISFLSVISMRILSNGYNFLKGYFKPPDKIIEELESGNIEDQRVDDNYAEKLVESLLKAKDKINISQNDIGNFVIGEKIDIQQYEEEKKKNIHYFELLSKKEQDFVKFINSIGINVWCYLKKDKDEFNIFSYQGIDDETFYNVRYRVESKFISILNKEKRIIAFSKKGLNQPIFYNKISKNDFNKLSILIIVPIFNNNILNAFFFIFDKSKDIEYSKRNYYRIYEFYKNNFNFFN